MNYATFEKLITLVLFGLLAACGGGGNAPESSGLPATVNDSLNQLGVPMIQSPRLSDDGVPLPEDFGPFGQRLKMAINAAGEARIGAPKELIVGGFSLAGATNSFAVLDNLVLPSVGNSITPAPIYSLSQTEAPWVREDAGREQDPPVTLRDAAGGDLDGDGYDEMIVAYAESGQVFVRIANLANRTVPDETLVVPIPADVLPVGDVRVAAADLDGSGRAKIIVSISQAAAAGRPTTSTLLILDKTASGLVTRHSRSFQSTLVSRNSREGTHVTTVLKPGNVDYDASEEIVLVINELVFDFGLTTIPSQATTRFVVLDDANHGFAELSADTLSVATGSDTYQAQVGDVAIGDIDGDMVNEIVFGGLAGLANSTTCNNTGSLRYLLITYEFTGSRIEKTKTAYSSDRDSLYPGNCNNNDANTWAIRFLSVNILNFDDDRIPEIQANQFIFSGMPEPGLAWSQRANFILPSSVMFPDTGTNTNLVFDRNSARIIVNDVDGNGRDDIVSYRGGDSGIRIHSWRQPLNQQGAPSGPPELYALAYVGTATTSTGSGNLAGRSVNPILVMLDADGQNEGDVQTLQFVDHRLEFIEPMVLAAIAAPPCKFDKGQNTDACTSSWGNSDVSGTDATRDVSVKAGIIVGTELEFQAGGGLVVNASTKVAGLSAKVELSRELGRHKSESYEVTRSVSFETGPMENSVVFVSTPYDFYTYKVIASTHVVTVDPRDFGAIGELQRLGLPRTPVIRQAEVGYYNAHTTARATKIDEKVFQHTIGRPNSYPTPYAREQILNTRRTQLDDIRLECPGCWRTDPNEQNVVRRVFRTFDPVAALPGLVSESVGVGQGSGATQVAIDFSRNSSSGRSMGINAELTVEVSGFGLVGGVVVGGGASWSTNITHGTSTAYVGTVGSIDGVHFAAEQYRFGMFTYLQGDPKSGKEFEVINYWVE
jgi:hypothetical protein